MNPQEPYESTTQTTLKPASAYEGKTAQEVLAQTQTETSGDNKHKIVLVAGSIASLIILGVAGYFIWTTVFNGAEQPAIPDASLITDDSADVESNIETLNDELYTMDDAEYQDTILSDDTIDQ